MLWFFLGYGIGGHNYYLGRIGIGIFQLILFIISWITLIFGIGLIIFAILGIWWLIDLIYVLNYQTIRLWYQLTLQKAPVII